MEGSSEKRFCPVELTLYAVDGSTKCWGGVSFFHTEMSLRDFSTRRVGIGDLVTVKFAFTIYMPNRVNKVPVNNNIVTFYH